jgi:hypothetical protein
VFAENLSPDREVARQFAVYGSVLVGGSALTLFWSGLAGFDRQGPRRHEGDDVGRESGRTSSTSSSTRSSRSSSIGACSESRSRRSSGASEVGLRASKAAAHEAARKAPDRPATPGRDPHPYRAIFALAIPSALSYVLMASETGVVNWLLKGIEHGKEALAAYAIYYRVFQFVVMPAIAASVAMLPFAARRSASETSERSRRVEGRPHGRRRLRRAGGTRAVRSRAVDRAASFDRLRSRSAISFPALRVVPLASLLAIPFFLCRPVFEGMGRGRPGLSMSLLRYVVLAAPAGGLGAAFGAVDACFGSAGPGGRADGCERNLLGRSSWSGPEEP